MPFQELSRWTCARIFRQHGKRLAVEGVVMSTVLEFFFDSTAHLDFVVESHGQVALVKEIVQV